MDLDAASYVQVIVEEGSFSDAARRLNISQPALSARVKKIEETYSIMIFQKNRRPATLTEEGRRYLDFISRVRSADRTFRQYIADTQELKSGEVRIGGTHLYTQCLLPPIVRTFHEAHPGIEVRIVNEKVPELAMMAAKGEIDLLISSPGKKSSGLHYEPLFQTRLYFCVPGEAPVNLELADFAYDMGGLSGYSPKKSLDLKKLENNTFIMLDETQHMGKVMRSMLKKCHAQPHDIIHTDQAMTAYAMTEAGVGISLIFDRIIELTPVSAPPVFYTVSDREMEGSMYMAYAQDSALSAAAQEFLKYTKEALMKPALPGSLRENAEICAGKRVSEGKD